MVVALAVVTAVAIGLALGGDLTNLARLRLRWWPLLLIAVALQAYSVGHWAGSEVAGIPIRAAAFVGTHALILAVAVANAGLDGIELAVVGALSNLLALVTNGGLMPVSPEARVAIGHQAAVDSLGTGAAVMGSKGVVVPEGQANLWFLTDIFVLPPPFPLPSVFSIGDLLVAIGLGYLIISTMRGRTITAR